MKSFRNFVRKNLFLVASLIAVVILIRFDHLKSSLEVRGNCDEPQFVGRKIVDTRPQTFEEIGRRWGTGGNGSFSRRLPAYTLQKGLYDPDSRAFIWTPANCNPSETIAIVVPYRQREQHLAVLLNNLHPFLRHQRIAFAIFVVEQTMPAIFNKGSQLNIGYMEAMKLHPFSCIVFHDVDLIPEDDRNLYICGPEPLHLSNSIDKFKYVLNYDNAFGGVVTLTPKHFERTHGYPNTYFGWGCEDDDMRARLKFAGLTLTRRLPVTQPYTMLRHGSDSGNPKNQKRRRRLRRAYQNWHSDTFRELRYEVQFRGTLYDGLVYKINTRVLYPIANN